MSLGRQEEKEGGRKEGKEIEKVDRNVRAVRAWMHVT